MQKQLYQHDGDSTHLWLTAREYEETSRNAVIYEREPHRLVAGTQISLASGAATALPDLDFETFSTAGLVFDDATGTWRSLPHCKKRGLPAVGAAVYAEHPSTRVLRLAYNLKDGTGPKSWKPGDPPPQDLFDHVLAYGLLEAHNWAFEWRVWNKVCVPKYDWPPLPFHIMRCSAEKARAFALPGALGQIGKILELQTKKLGSGKDLIKMFCVPRNRTKHDPRLWHDPCDFPEESAEFDEYNDIDIVTESEASAHIPDLSGDELLFALATRAMNIRGCHVDLETTRGAIKILDQIADRYDAEVYDLTAGDVPGASKTQKLKAWLNEGYGIETNSLDDEHLTALLKKPLPDDVRRVLEIRKETASAGVKKVYALDRMTTADSRICDLFVYHRARTGRDGAVEVQPQNLCKAGPELSWCEDPSCGKSYGAHLDACPHCGASEMFSTKKDWSWEGVEDAVAAIRTGDLDHVEGLYGNATLAISGVIRGLFTSAPEHDLICSDFSSIEAVVTAVLSGEQWRIDAFREKKDIYLLSASSITGIPYEEYLAYPEQHGTKHPDRQKTGKPAELGLGFGGWINALYQFGYEGTEAEAKAVVNPWRAASPAIVEMWGGQVRGKPWAPDRHELYGLEGCAIAAVQNPGQSYEYRGIAYVMADDKLFCRLPSGRLLTYHSPELRASTRWEGQLSLSFMGYNTNPTMGPVGWIRIDTFGGRLFQNVVQATARDILRHSVLNLERNNYPVVLRVHDEIVSEVPEGYGSIEEFEQIMATMPDWAADWPIRATDGWRGKRYRKD